MPQPPPPSARRYEHVQWFHEYLRAVDAAVLSAEVRALEALVCVQQMEAPLRQLLYEQGLLRPWAPLSTALLQKFFLRKYQVGDDHLMPHLPKSSVILNRERAECAES
jgi:hypothetical protein